MTLLLALLACSGPDTPVAPSVLDLRQDYPLPPDGGLQLTSPDLFVPAYSEHIFCYYGTWLGPDSAVNLLSSYQVLPYNHHNQVKSVPEGGPPDGTLEECDEEDMRAYQPFIDGVPPYDIAGGANLPPPSESWNQMDLPDGYAVKLDQGRRWVLETHYVNTTDQDLLVNSAINLGFMPIEDVNTWVGVLQLDSGPPAIPPGEYTLEFDCAFQTDLEILVVSSHMHENGMAYAVDFLPQDGGSERIHEVPEWNDGFRAYPKLDVWEPGELTVIAGEVFRTSCSWNNRTEDVLNFPEEMCTTLVVAAPIEAPLGCYDGLWRE